MSAPQFTPGPWEVRGSGSIVSVNASCPEEKIARCFGMTSPRMRADARLIAAAPEGYDAAGVFIMAAINEWNIPEGREADEGWLCDTLGHALADAFLKAMAFRAKARGEQ